ncbi:MAG: thrombospondin type 3 repeat-containing protein [Candidatus Peregrinibacteria bacterium]|nr:thrombospondin type 3 repeat-containing protein [Candidatus Peregrinibacteria bacterium]
MNTLRLATIGLLCAATTAFAAPAYERPISLPSLNASTPVFLALPASLTAAHSLEGLRIHRGGALEPMKTSAEKEGELRGIIDHIIVCSIEGGSETALHDGNASTVLRPDPLGNPSTCSMEVVFVTEIRVNAVSIDADTGFTKVTVSARNDAGAFVKLREAKNSADVSFSDVTTDRLRIDLSYEFVPSIGEVNVQGTQPARILFLAEPGEDYVLVYGDPNPPVLPLAPASLAATIDTPYARLGAEVSRGEDADGDGIDATRDNCVAIANADQADRDRDGIGDACDNAPNAPNAPQNDWDHDGVGDANDNCPEHFNPDQRDDDLNDIGNPCDDPDHDRVLTHVDNCPGISNPTQEDSDGNGVGNACELDRDSDGVPDAVDVCRSVANPDQADADDDGIGDKCDSCPAVRNPNQDDRNSNGLGDACEGSVLDPDQDGIPNANDVCPAAPNPDQADRDNDGLGDMCDNCPTIQNRDQRDLDKDGQGEACTDLDSDGLLPPLDNCPTVANEDQEDKNNDGKGDACEDDDGDGILNGNDNCRYKSNYSQEDQDADGSGDICDTADDRFSERYPWLVWIGLSFIVLILVGFAVRMVVQIQRGEKQ